MIHQIELKKSSNLQKCKSVQLKWGKKYLSTLEKVVFSSQKYLDDVVIDSQKKDDCLQKRYSCRQCEESFHFESSLEDHLSRKSWILGYSCIDCFTNPENGFNGDHSNAESHRKSSRLNDPKKKYSDTLNNKNVIPKNQKTRTILLFYNQCQFLEHLKIHNKNSESLDINKTMLMFIPQELQSDEYENFEKTCKILMKEMFIKNMHIMDWLRLMNINFKWWLTEPHEANPVADILRRHYTTCVEQYGDCDKNTQIHSKNGSTFYSRECYEVTEDKCKPEMPPCSLQNGRKNINLPSLHNLDFTLNKNPGPDSVGKKSSLSNSRNSCNKNSIVILNNNDSMFDKNMAKNKILILKKSVGGKKRIKSKRRLNLFLKRLENQQTKIHYESSNLQHITTSLNKLSPINRKNPSILSLSSNELSIKNFPNTEIINQPQLHIAEMLYNKLKDSDVIKESNQNHAHTFFLDKTLLPKSDQSNSDDAQKVLAITRYFPSLNSHFILKTSDKSIQLIYSPKSNSKNPALTEPNIKTINGSVRENTPYKNNVKDVCEVSPLRGTCEILPIIESSILPTNGKKISAVYKEELAGESAKMLIKNNNINDKLSIRNLVRLFLINGENSMAIHLSGLNGHPQIVEFNNLIESTRKKMMDGNYLTIPQTINTYCLDNDYFLTESLGCLKNNVTVNRPMITINQRKFQRPCRFALNSPTNVESPPINYKCHICQLSINTSWEVIKNHFQDEHSEDYKLVTMTPQLPRISSEIKTKNDDKKRKSEFSTSPRKKSRPVNRKLPDRQTLSNQGMCVQQESLQHAAAEGSLKCKKCEKLFHDVKVLHQHVASNHRIQEHFLICLECGENFVVISSLEMHLRAFHGIDDPAGYMSQNVLYEANTIDEISVQDRITKLNQCYVCMAMFEDKTAVEKHLRVHGMAFLNRRRIQVLNATKNHNNVT